MHDWTLTWPLNTSKQEGESPLVNTPSEPTKSCSVSRVSPMHSDFNFINRNKNSRFQVCCSGLVEDSRADDITDPTPTPLQKRNPTLKNWHVCYFYFLLKLLFFFMLLKNLCDYFFFVDQDYVKAGMVGLAVKWVRLAPNWTNPALFQIRFQYIWLTHFGAQPSIPVSKVDLTLLYCRFSTCLISSVGLAVLMCFIYNTLSEPLNNTTDNCSRYLNLKWFSGT